MPGAETETPAAADAAAGAADAGNAADAAAPAAAAVALLPSALVTGAAGFLGAELTRQLLEKGYRVRATLRDAGSPGADTLRRLAAALPGALELLEADLLAPGAFDAACAGVDFVFHLASPFSIDAADPQAELVDVAVAGTVNVLGAAAAARVRRAVVTSSVAAVKGRRPKPPAGGAAYTEDDWNDTSTVEGGEAYWLGKAAAERAAWALAREHGLDLVAVLPDFVMGPPLSRAARGSTSVGWFKAWVEGGAHAGCATICDVRDVARAHILAAETPTANGRYIVAAGPAPPQDVARWLGERFPGAAFAAPAAEAPAGPGVDASRARRDLGLALTPVRETLLDMAAAMISLGLAAPKPKLPVA
jgi:nucleoside-diphosphate-sugar epimerase